MEVSGLLRTLGSSKCFHTLSCICLPAFTTSSAVWIRDSILPAPSQKANFLPSFTCLSQIGMWNDEINPAPSLTFVVQPLPFNQSLLITKRIPATRHTIQVPLSPSPSENTQRILLNTRTINFLPFKIISCKVSFETIGQSLYLSPWL